MAFVLPIEELLEKGSPNGACGSLDPENEAQVDVLFEAVKRDKEANLYRLRQVAEGLFRGGEIPDLSSAKDGRVPVKPIKHLKAAMVLTLAGLGIDGICGFSDGLVLIERLLKTHWENVHPLADTEDQEDPYIRRVNILNPLSIADPAKGITLSDSWRIEERLLKSALLASDRHGALSLRDCLSPWRDKTIEFGNDGTEPRSIRLSLPAGEDRSAEFVHEVRLASADMLPRQQQALQTAVAAVESIKSVFKDKKGTIKPSLDYLIALLKAALIVLDNTPTLGQTPVAVATQRKPPASGPSSQAAGPVSSREEAVRKLTEVAEYFRRTEPSSPVPLLIDRVKCLAGKDFMTLVEELQLGDDAEKEFRKLAGIRKKPDEAGSVT